jgi:hypothetical protein
MWYSGEIKTVKPEGLEWISTPKGDYLKASASKPMKFQWTEDGTEWVPFNLNLQFSNNHLRSLLRNEKGQKLLDSPQGMTGAWYSMEQELLSRKATQIQLLVCFDSDAASSIQVGRNSHLKKEVAEWILSPGSIQAINWASPGDKLYLEGLSLPDQVVDVSQWEKETEDKEKAVIKVEEVVMQDKKATSILNRKYSKWLKETDNSGRHGEETVQREYLATFHGPFAKWLATEGKMELALETLSKWQPLNQRKAGGGRRSKGKVTEEVQKETAKPQEQEEEEAKPEPKPEKVEGKGQGEAEFEEEEKPQRRKRRGALSGGKASKVSESLADDDFE